MPKVKIKKTTDPLDESIDEFRENTIKRLIELSKYSDTEAVHQIADELLCEWLQVSGEHEMVEAFEALDKWYA